MGQGLIIAAPTSGSGKTTVTLGLLRALARRGIAVSSAKAGPDYIDPVFHAAASGRICRTLDSWAMRPATLAGLAAETAREAELVIAEGVMGLFDGAAGPGGVSIGSTADLAAATGWPVVLVVDSRGMAASAAAMVSGFGRFRPDVRVAGAIFNRVASERHRLMISAACAQACPEVALLGFMPPLTELTTPSRHLGLVQACEHPDLDAFLDRAADAVAAHVDLAALAALARPGLLDGAALELAVPPLGQRIAVARDEAFAFAYPSLLEGWRRAGAALSFFSPLADQGPDADADAVYLPGGYPELHAARLAAASCFQSATISAAARGAALFGECGGYMVLGRSLTAADGTAHPMLGLLPVETSFAARALHLGYRRACLLADGPLGAAGTVFRGHEFHFATIAAESATGRLFAIADASGAALAPCGHQEGKICGSYIHIIDRDDKGG